MQAQGSQCAASDRAAAREPLRRAGRRRPPKAQSHRADTLSQMSIFHASLHRCRDRDHGLAHGAWLRGEKTLPVCRVPMACCAGYARFDIFTADNHWTAGQKTSPRARLRQTLGPLSRRTRATPVPSDVRGTTNVVSCRRLQALQTSAPPSASDKRFSTQITINHAHHILQIRTKSASNKLSPRYSHP